MIARSMSRSTVLFARYGTMARVYITVQVQLTCSTKVQRFGLSRTFNYNSIAPTRTGTELGTVDDNHQPTRIKRHTRLQPQPNMKLGSLATINWTSCRSSYRCMCLNSDFACGTIVFVVPDVNKKIFWYDCYEITVLLINGTLLGVFKFNKEDVKLL